MVGHFFWSAMEESESVYLGPLLSSNPWPKWYHVVLGGGCAFAFTSFSKRSRPMPTFISMYNATLQFEARKRKHVRCLQSFEWRWEFGALGNMNGRAVHDLCCAETHTTSVTTRCHRRTNQMSASHGVCKICCWMYKHKFLKSLCMGFLFCRDVF